MRQPLSILIVDANADEREMLRLALASDRYHVADVAGAQTALDILRSSHIDCLVVDFDWAQSDAAEFCSARRRDRAFAWLPLIVLSARPDLEEVAMRLGARAYLRKPFDLEALRRTVAEITRTGANWRV